MLLRLLLSLFICSFSITLSVSEAFAVEPVIAPWSVDNTSTQSRIRQYQTFRHLNDDPATPSKQAAHSTYEYQSAADNALPKATNRRTSPNTFLADIERAPPSALETMYAGRIVQPLDQFGYELFGVPSDTIINTLNSAAETSPSLPSGAVQDNFVVNMGDQLEIFFTGQRTDRGIYEINSQGQILIEDFPPIPAAGRTIGQVRISIEAAAKNLYNTTPYISLTSVRQIGVLVVGHVKQPGRQTLTVFHTILDALMEAGGVEKTGSLRQIKLVRDGRSAVVDLYGLLLHGSANMDFQLRDGDRIIVPPIGPTVAVAGEIKRPGIYEILPEVSSTQYRLEQRSEVLTLNEMLELGGGVLAPGKNRFIRLAVTNEGREQTTEINDAYKPLFYDGSILDVSKGTEHREGSVELLGHTRRPGTFALSDHKTLSALLSDNAVAGPDIYPLIGVIERYDNDQLSRSLLSFPLRLVLSGEFDRKLEDGDAVHLFSNSDIRALDTGSESIAQIEPAGASSNNDPFEGELEYGSRSPSPYETTLADDTLMRNFLREHAAFVRGSVRQPGVYPVAEGVTLDSILSTAGGLSLEADTSNIEITSAHNGPSTTRTAIDFHETRATDIVIGPGDSVRVNQRFSKPDNNSVLIMGEVKNPGRYDLLPGDKVSDLLERAGGLTAQAYPLGSIFSRASERRAEEARFRAQASSMEQSIAAALSADDEKVNAGKIAEARSLASELRNAQGVGRITVETDPGVLAANPELDMLLQEGDRIFVPKRTLTVRVNGEVLSPAALQFRDKKTPVDYIQEAGGFTFDADKERTFVLYPDGSAQPIRVSSWNYEPLKIPPGSTIVVPRDPKPFDFVQSAKDVSQILSNLAVTAIFVDDLNDDD